MYIFFFFPSFFLQKGITKYIFDVYGSAPPKVFSIRIAGKDLTFGNCFKCPIHAQLFQVSDPVMMDAIVNDPSQQLTLFSESMLPLIKNLFALTSETVLGVGEQTKDASHTMLKGSEVDAAFERATEIARPIIESVREGVNSSSLFQVWCIFSLWLFCNKAPDSRV